MRTKRGVDRLVKRLSREGVNVVGMHGDKSQGQRERALASFEAGRIDTLVATDVAARGIHVDGIDLVIHADPPTEHKAYVHRSGRTARGGADGAVVTVQTAGQAAEVRVLMRKAGVTPQAVTAGPASAAVRSIAGPPVTRVAPVTRLAPAATPGAAPATGRGAAAASGSFRGSRGRR